jgi:hypothetical protein
LATFSFETIGRKKKTLGTFSTWWGSATWGAVWREWTDTFYKYFFRYIFYKYFLQKYFLQIFFQIFFLQIFVKIADIFCRYLPKYIWNCCPFLKEIHTILNRGGIRSHDPWAPLYSSRRRRTPLLDQPARVALTKHT